MKYIFLFSLELENKLYGKQPENSQNVKYFKEKYWIDNIKFNEEKVIEFLKNN